MLCRPFGDLSSVWYVWLCYVGPIGDLSRDLGYVM